MPISRRDLFRQLGIGAAATAALPSLAEIGLGAALPFPASSGSAGPGILSRNENAYGPSEKVIGGVGGEGHGGNCFPVGQDGELRDRGGGLHKHKGGGIGFGCGSSEI